MRDPTSIGASQLAGIAIRQAGALRLGSGQASDVEEVSAILLEAARWLEGRGMAMWRDDELGEERIRKDIEGGLFFLAHSMGSGQAVGTLKFQLEDRLFWPEAAEGEAAYVHRLAVRRRFAGGRVSTAMLRWAALHTQELGRRYLRLDCEASRPHLRAVYERFGFRFHSERQVGPYRVARYEYKVQRRS